MLRAIGKTCLALAVLVAAYIVWLLWGTGVYTAQQQQELRRDITTRIAGPDREPVVLKGDAYAVLKIPRIHLDTVVVQGVEVEDLKKGPGHYSKTDDPWEDTGRVGIAGHRTTYGHPFWSLNRLRPGDRILLRTEAGDFPYRVARAREVLPSAIHVLDPTKRPTLVLTTCTPRFSAARRLIVVARRTLPGDRPPGPGGPAD